MGWGESGSRMWTDCCHRLCAGCREANQSAFEPQVFHLATEDVNDVDAVARRLFEEDELEVMELAELLEV